MNALLEIRETQSQGLESPRWLPGLTSGLKKSKNQPQIKIYSDQEPYDNIKMEGTSLFPKEEPHLERFNSEIINIRADVAEMKADIRDIKGDVSEIKTDVAVLKTDIKHITENTQKVPSLVTDVAVIKTTLNITNKILYGVLIAIIAGLVLTFLT